ncbi:MAG: FctA domain-containing protein [Clostridia bacterium]
MKNGDYRFKITAINGAPLSNGKSSIVAANVGNEVTFTSKTFTIADAQGATATDPLTYKYTLEEVLPKEATAENEYKVEGITYDPTQYTIELNIYIQKVNGKDTVVVDRTYKDDNGKPLGANEVPVFHNSYSAAPVNTALKGEKTLTGRDMLENETFDFTLTAGDESTGKAINAGTVAIAKNDDRASVSGGTNKVPTNFNFGAVTFKKEGTYTFDIKETVPSPKAGGMTYDQHTTKATVVVTDDAANPGKLKASVTYNNGTVSDTTDKAVFENKYEASHAYSTSGGLNVEKVLNGRTMKAGEFKFKITPKDGAPGVSPEGEKFTNPEQRVSGEPDSMQKLQGLVSLRLMQAKLTLIQWQETAGRSQRCDIRRHRIYSCYQSRGQWRRNDVHSDDNHVDCSRRFSADSCL